MNRSTQHDDSIPVLTQRAPAHHAPPVLNEQVSVSDQAHPDSAPRSQNAPPWTTASRPPAHPARTQADAFAFGAPRPQPAAAISPADTVLRASLQAAIEEAVQDALDEALIQVKLRLEARLPEIVARALQNTRSG